MLEEISIKGLGIIDNTVLEFKPGLNVITGETGAGKTMVLTGLHLLLGRRADSGMVSEKANATIVEGQWTIANDSTVKNIEETGAILEDSTLYVNRTVKKDGKSRAVLGGKTTPAGVLTAIGADLVNIHGQSDQLRLKNTIAQLEAVDRYSPSLHKSKTSYVVAYREWKAAKKELLDLEKNAELREFEHGKLLKLNKDLAKLDPEEGEIRELEQRIERLSHTEQIVESLREAVALVASEESFSPEDQLRQSLKALSAAVEYSESLGLLKEEGEQALELLGKYIDGLASEASSMDEDSVELLYSSQDRLTDLKAFERRYKMTIDEALAAADAREERIKELDPEVNSVENLKEQAEEAETKMLKLAESLTKARKKAAAELASKVNSELKGLAMASSEFAIGFNEAKPSSAGCDEVLFMLSHSGSTPKPLAKSASGGELSRVMLALEVVLADPTAVPTFVFDEVDSGIGGATAIEIGKRLAKLAESAQVIVVTHLPQVAAYGNSHIKVIKTKGSTTVKNLTEVEREKEIARMLSGQEESSKALEHAKELLSLASEAMGT